MVIVMCFTCSVIDKLYPWRSSKNILLDYLASTVLGGCHMLLISTFGLVYIQGKRHIVRYTPPYPPTLNYEFGGWGGLQFLAKSHIPLIAYQVYWLTYLPPPHPSLALDFGVGGDVKFFAILHPTHFHRRTSTSRLSTLNRYLGMKENSIRALCLVDPTGGW